MNTQLDCYFQVLVQLYKGCQLICPQYWS